MNAPVLSGFHVASADRESGEDQMEQIRELVLGEYRRRNEAQLARIEARLDALTQRLDALSAEIDSERRSSFDALSKGVLDLGEQIRRITKT